MILKVLITALLALGLMLVVKNHAFLRHTGLVSYCSSYTAPGATGHWETCKQGFLDGQPNLGGKGCRHEWTQGPLAGWFCPAQPAAGPEGF
jgi:hypothetical protein